MKYIKIAIIGLFISLYVAHIDAATLRITNKTGQQLRAEVIWNVGSWWYPVDPGDTIPFSSPWNKDIIAMRWIENGFHYTWRVRIPTVRLKTAWCQILPGGSIRFQIGNTVQLIKIKSDEEQLSSDWEIID